MYFKESGAAYIGKRSHSGHDFHSRNQELIGTGVPQTLEIMNRNDVNRHKWDPTGFREEEDGDSKQSVVLCISNAINMEISNT